MGGKDPAKTETVIQGKRKIEKQAQFMPAS